MNIRTLVLGVLLGLLLSVAAAFAQEPPTLAGDGPYTYCQVNAYNPANVPLVRACNAQADFPTLPITLNDADIAWCSRFSPYDTGRTVDGWNVGERCLPLWTGRPAGPGTDLTGECRPTTLFVEGHAFAPRVTWLVLFNPLDAPVTVRFSSTSFGHRDLWFYVRVAPGGRFAYPVSTLATRVGHTGGFALEVVKVNPAVGVQLVSWDEGSGVYTNPYTSPAQESCRVLGPIR
jgi:hypothetical protein